MTGEGFRVMNFSKLLTITFFLMFACGMAKSAKLAETMLTINATFINLDVILPYLLFMIWVR